MGNTSIALLSLLGLASRSFCWTCRDGLRRLLLGQFLPSEASNPTIGKPGSMEFVEEDRVEIIVNDSGERHELKQAIVELKSVRRLKLDIEASN